MVLSEFGGSGTDQFGQPQSAQALGTGFVVDGEGYILTNAHVVDESGQRANSVTVVFNKGGSETQRVPGQLVGLDIGSDVAVIKVDPAQGRPQASAARRLRQGRRRRAGRGHRQPARVRLLHHLGHRLGDGAQPPGAERPDHPQRHPDGRRDQPGQLGRTAHRQLRQGHRHQRADRLVGRRQRRPRLRRAHQHRRALARADQGERQGDLRLDGRQPPDAHQRHRRHVQHADAGRRPRARRSPRTARRPRPASRAATRR